MNTVFFNAHGGPEVLQYAEFPTPEPKPGEVLIRLHAAALNHADLFTRIGWPGLKLDYPHILGCDGAGEVAELGTGVKNFQVGDRVVINANLGCGECEFCLAGQDNMCRNWHLLGETIRGTYAEYIALPARQLFPIPIEFSFREAAAAALVFLTAWHSLVKRGNLRAGESVLVIGASGGVNTASIQIAKYAGAQVLVVGSDKKKLSLAESLGADVLIDRSQQEDWSKAVYLATQRRGVDLVVDNVGITFPSSFRASRKGGRLLTVGNTGGPKFEIDNRYIFAKHLSIIGSTMGTLQDFSEVMALVLAGKFHAVLDQTFPLKDAAKAHRRLESGQQLGKVTLEIG